MSHITTTLSQHISRYSQQNHHPHKSQEHIITLPTCQSLPYQHKSTTYSNIQKPNILKQYKQGSKGRTQFGTLFRVLPESVGWRINILTQNIKPQIEHLESVRNNKQRPITIIN